MSSLISCHDISKSYGPKKLFQNLSLHLHKGDKIGVVGPNGAGKSTLLKIIFGTETPDTGTVSRSKDAKIAFIPQVPNFSGITTTFEAMREALKNTDLFEDEREHRIKKTLSMLGFPKEDQDIANFSGGWKKRLAIACGLATEPNLLLLDEPTNHLDLEGILWLEKLLQSPKHTFLLISHDRTFLERTAKKIVEIDRIYPEGLLLSEGNYSKFLERRAEFFQQQQKLQDALKNKVKHEIDWLRRSPKARTTKNQSRVKAALATIDEYHKVKDRNRKEQGTIQFQSSEKRSKELVVLDNVAKSYEDKTLFQNLSFVISAGMHIGLCGPNGCGKSTLLKMIQGKVEPSDGNINTVENLHIVYFDQHREQLNPEATLKQTLSPDGDQVIFRGEPVHVASWAKRFLFRSEQLGSKMSTLSGGEQARALFARMMLEPADLLVLDEPTNDLDIPTLEILEDNLKEYEGALLLVSHDRYLLDSISHCLLGFLPNGELRVYADYLQWEEEHKQEKQQVKQAKKATYTRKKSPLSYKEKKELESMEEVILELESSIEEKQAQISDPAIASDSGKVQEIFQEIQTTQEEVDRLYQRWEELEEKKKQ